MGRTYCDFNAGALLRPEARAAVVAALDAGGNASSIHGFGRRAKALLEDAREQVAQYVNARTDNVVFTSGATEALHLALDSARANGFSRLLASAIEHDALYQHAQQTWPEVETIKVDAQGRVDLAALEAQLKAMEGAPLAAIMLANNETGIIQDFGPIAALMREAGGALLVDAAQAFGKIPVDIVDLDATYLTLSGHKVGGPLGAGALVLQAGAPFSASRFGGGQERGRRPGTENIPALAGFGAAAEVSIRELSRENARLGALRDRFEQLLPDDAVVFSKDGARLPNTSLFALPGMAAETAVIALDLAGVAVSSGAACSSGKVRPSRVLEAMGVAPELVRGAIRVSFGWSSTDADVDAAAGAVREIAARRRSAQKQYEGAA